MTTIKCPHCGKGVTFQNRHGGVQASYRITLTDNGREWLAADKAAKNAD